MARSSLGRACCQQWCRGSDFLTLWGRCEWKRVWFDLCEPAPCQWLWLSENVCRRKRDEGRKDLSRCSWLPSWCCLQTTNGMCMFTCLRHLARFIRNCPLNYLCSFAQVGNVVSCVFKCVTFTRSSKRSPSGWTLAYGSLARERKKRKDTIMGKLRINVVGLLHRFFIFLWLYLFFFFYYRERKSAKGRETERWREGKGREEAFTE